MKGWIWSAAVTLLIAVASYVAFDALRPTALPAGLIYGNGHIEGTEIAVSAEIAGRVAESRLVEGETVAAGDLLMRLDDAELAARLAQAEAEAAALAQTRVRVGREMETSQHHLGTAREDLQRLRTLKARGMTTAQQIDGAENRLREAQGRIEVLRAQGSEIEARRTAARQQVEVLRLQQAKTLIRAPLSGTVLTKAIEPGELAAPGRVVAVIVDLTRLDLKVYVPERDIGKLRLGAAARVRVDAFPGRHFDATVRQVDQQAQFTPRDIHLPEERVRMVFGVKLAVENPRGELKPGMPADAWIRVAKDVPWPEQLPIPQ